MRNEGRPNERLLASARTPRRRPLAASLPIGALAVVALMLAGCGGAAPKERIVLITLDTLRFDSLAGVEGSPTTMPRLRSFAERGLSFERFYSASATTQPSHASLFTGLHPWQHGVVRNGCLLAPELDTLAERLDAVGFETAATVASFAVHSRFGFDQGFERYDDDFSIELETGKDRWMGHDLEDAFYSLAPDVTEKALALLDSMSEGRQFLWVHYYDPHTPYGDTAGTPFDLMDLRANLVARPSFADQTIARGRSLYDEDVSILDRELGRLLERIERESDVYETHVVLVSDHGESFGESNSLGHGNRLTPEQVRVPMVLMSPRVRPGVRRDIGGMVDLYPTLLALAGITGVPSRGRDLLATSEGFAYGMRRLPAKGVVREVRADGTTVEHVGPRFFIALEDGLVTGDGEHLFADDEREPTLADDVADDVRRLFATFADELDGGDVRALDDEETVQALGALGYGE